jgi:O-antigen ligase
MSTKNANNVIYSSVIARQRAGCNCSVRLGQAASADKSMLLLYTLFLLLLLLLLQVPTQQRVQPACSTLSLAALACQTCACLLMQQ